MANLDKRFDRDGRISWQTIENEVVLVDHDEGEVFHLNPIATEIWQALDGKRTVSDIVDHIYRSFEVDVRRAQKDVLRFLNQLIRREMVAEMLGDGRDPS